MGRLDWGISAGAVAAVVFGGLASPATLRQAAHFVHLGAYGPQAEVRLARPTIRWRIWSDDPDEKVVSCVLTIDHHAVPASYDAELRSIIYRPDAPLSAGPHDVETSISFSGGRSFNKQWKLTVAASAMPSLPLPTSSQMEALAALNDIRGRYRLPAAELDDTLDIAALAHSEYLSLNKATGHGEVPGTPGYVGSTGSERLGSFGWTGGSWEVVSFGGKTVRESIEDLFDAPYHRLPFLQVGAPHIGAGYVGDRFTMEFDQPEVTGTSVSPPDGATGVPCTWHDYERPNPMRLYGGGTNVTGYPIVIAHFAPGLPKLTKVFGWLTGPGKQDVPCWINTPQNDDILTCAAILIPKEPLQPHVTYHAGFDGRDATGSTVREEVAFTTGPLVP